MNSIKVTIDRRHTKKQIIEAIKQQNLNVISNCNGQSIEVFDMKAIKEMQNALSENDEKNHALRTEDSTTTMHIYDRRSFRVFSY